MPAFQDSVHVRPNQILLFQNGPVIGLLYGLRRKAHFHPGLNILLLRGGRDPVPYPQAALDPAALLPPVQKILHVPLRQLQGDDPPFLPDIGFLFDLPQSRPFPRAIPAFQLLGTPVDDHQDHFRRETEIIIDPEQDHHIVAGKQPPQAFRRFVQQPAEAFRVFGRPLHV